MENEPRISVVVPVWNPGPGIGACIESLLGQTLADLEAVFVDDRGDGAAMGAVRAAAARDPRVRVLENPANLGAGPSRNAGIEAARGRYLAFLDADDRLAPDFLELLWDRARLSGFPDIVKGAYIELDEDGSPAVGEFGVRQNNTMRARIENGDPYYVLFRYGHQSALYRRDFIKDHGITYGVTRNGEDGLFLLRACCAASGLAIEDAACYYRIHNKGSLARSYGPERFDGELAGLRAGFEFMSEFLRDDPFVCERVRELVQWELGVCVESSQVPELEVPCARFFDALREEVGRLPFVDELVEQYVDMKALVLDGANLCLRAHRRSGWKERAQANLVVFEHWVDYACKHPEEGKRCAVVLRRLWDDATSFFSEAMRSPATSLDAAEYLRRMKSISARYQGTYS